MQRPVQLNEKFLLLRWHSLQFTTILADLEADCAEYIVHFTNLGLFILDKAHLLTIFTRFTLKRLRLVTDFWKKRPSFVVVVCLCVIFDVNIHSLHVIVDELSIKAKLLSACIVGAGPKWLLHFFLFLGAKLQWLAFDLIKSITSTLDGPVDKLHQLLDLNRCVVPGHLFSKLPCDSLLHVTFSFID